MNTRTIASKVLQWLFVAIAVMFFVLLVGSWIVAVYDDRVNALLSVNGFRWLFSNFVSNFGTVPLAEMLFGMLGLSTLFESGIFSIRRSHVSLKQSNALRITAIVVVFTLLLFSALLFMPNAILLSAFGELSDSPFTRGLFGFVIALFFLIGTVFGYASGKYVSFDDFFHAQTAVFSRIGNYFVILFLAAQLVCCLDYTDIMLLSGYEDEIIIALKVLFYYVPFVISLFLNKK